LSSLGNFSDLAYGNQFRLAEPFLMLPRLTGTLHLAWCPDNDSVIHKYLAEMRRLARDATPFLSVV
jgi:hypothetical protein